MSFPIDRATNAELALHEALRRSHCDHSRHDNPNHRCVGTTTITPNGVKLSCTLCGSANLEDRVGDAEHGHYARFEVTEKTKRHLEVLNSSVSKTLFDLMNATEELEPKE